MREVKEREGGREGCIEMEGTVREVWGNKERKEEGKEAEEEGNKCGRGQ